MELRSFYYEYSLPSIVNNMAPRNRKQKTKPKSADNRFNAWQRNFDEAMRNLESLQDPSYVNGPKGADLAASFNKALDRLQKARINFSLISTPSMIHEYVTESEIASFESSSFYAHGLPLRTASPPEFSELELSNNNGIEDENSFPMANIAPITAPNIVEGDESERMIDSSKVANRFASTISICDSSSTMESSEKAGKEQRKSPSVAADIKTVYDNGLVKMISCRAEKTVLRTEPVEMAILDGNYKWKLKLAITGEDSVRKLKVSTERIGQYLFDDKIELHLVVENGNETIEEKGFRLPLNLRKQVFQIRCDKDSRYDGIALEQLVVSAYFKYSPVSYIRNNFGHELHYQSEDRPHDRILMVEDTKFRVMSVYLATWSKYFDRLFFANFKKEKEIELPDVDAWEFEQLMDLIHPNMFTELKDSNVLTILKLADRFEMPSVMSMCGKYLSNFDNCDPLTPMDRLELADTHMLADLQIACLDHIKAMKNKEEYCNKMRERLQNLSKNCLANLA